MTNRPLDDLCFCSDQQVRGNLAALAHERGNDSVADAVWQLVRPLRDSGRRDTECLGSKCRSFEQFESAGLFHEPMLARLNNERKSTYIDSGFNCAYMSTLQERMAEFMAETGWTVGRIADVAKVSPSAVSQWVNGPTLSIALEASVLIERETGFSALWLSKGKGKRGVSVSASSDVLEPQFAGKARTARRVAIVGTAKLGEDGFYEEISSVVGAGDGHIEIATEDPNAYGLRVRGQSMFPAIRDGWYVLVEPNGEPRVGEYVLLKLKDGRKMVKELLNRRSGGVEVMSVNGGTRLSFDVFELEDIQAVGAVVSPSKWRSD